MRTYLVMVTIVKLTLYRNKTYSYSNSLTVSTEILNSHLWSDDFAIKQEKKSKNGTVHL